jgi:hypothetical protein
VLDGNDSERNQWVAKVVDEGAAAECTVGIKGGENGVECAANATEQGVDDIEIGGTAKWSSDASLSPFEHDFLGIVHIQLEAQNRNCGDRPIREETHFVVNYLWSFPGML